MNHGITPPTTAQNSVITVMGITKERFSILGEVSGANNYHPEKKLLVF